MDFQGFYTSTDGKHSVDLSKVHQQTWINAFVKCMDHVYGNEAISKGSTAKAKAGIVGDAYTDTFTQEMYDGIIAAARVGYDDAVYSGTWGEKGTRAPRTPGLSRLEAIFNMIHARDTRAAMAAAGKPKGSEDDTWLTDDGVSHPLKDWMAVYLSNPTHGAARRESIEKRANAQLEAEKVAAEERKAAKAREAGTAAGSGLSI